MKRLAPAAFAAALFTLSCVGEPSDRVFGGGTQATTTCTPSNCRAPNDCKKAVCEGNTCRISAKANGTSCHDGNYCTTGDTCQSGTCTSGPTKTCVAQDQCHVAGVCNPSTGACSNPNKADGTACSDNDACTQIDRCQAGRCEGVNPLTYRLKNHPDAQQRPPAYGLRIDQLFAGRSSITSGRPAARGAVTTFSPESNGAQLHLSFDPVARTLRIKGTVYGGEDKGTVYGFGAGLFDLDFLYNVHVISQGGGWIVERGSGSSQNFGSLVARSGNLDLAAGTTFHLYDYTSGTGASFLFLPDGHRLPVGSVDFVGRGALTTSSSRSRTCTTQDWLFVGEPLDCPPGLEACCAAQNPCRGKPNGTTCDDGNACTRTDSCQNEVCVGANPVTCTALDQCHVVGTCNPVTGACSNPSKDDGTACNDGDGCTRTDTCQNGSCTGGNRVTCTAQDQCHLAGTCDPVSGVCSNPNKSNGSACNDGNACTRTDTCQSGTCRGSNSVTCTAKDQCHVAGTCEPQSGACSNPPKPSGAECSDGNACTIGDACQSGACMPGSAVQCLAKDQCHSVGVCNPSSGVCSDPARPNGSACNDGNACTRTDTCQSGACTGQNPVACPASDQCHSEGVCSPSSGLCSNPAKADGAACDDGAVCTQLDTCQAGACLGQNPRVYVLSDHPDSDVAPPTYGLRLDDLFLTRGHGGNATFSFSAHGGGVFMTFNPVAKTLSIDGVVWGGVSTGGSWGYGEGGYDLHFVYNVEVAEQAGGFVVHKGSSATQNHGSLTVRSGNADLATGTTFPLYDYSSDQSPSFLFLPDGHRLSEISNDLVGRGWLSWLPSHAQSGGVQDFLFVGRELQCPPGVSEACCAPPQPCANRPDGAACDDGDLCTVGDTCQTGNCVGGAPTTCSALDQCHDAGTCSPQTGQCSTPAKANGTTCNDGNACTEVDRCQAGVCQGQSPVVCTAQSSCHDIGTCDPSSGVCSNPVKGNGTACDDHNPCTRTDSCQNGACNGANPVICAPLDDCHEAGVCNTVTGDCSNPPKADGASCSDGNACTQNDGCSAGTCTGTQIVCPAPDQCHLQGTCDPVDGQCSNPIKANGASCNDADACTQIDSCQAGTCTGQNPQVYLLRDHPDGEQAPPFYGLRLDDLFLSRGHGGATTFSFESQGAHVYLTFNPVEKTLSLDGVVWGGRATGGAFGFGQGAYDLHFVYNVNVLHQGQGWIVQPMGANASQNYGTLVARAGNPDIPAGTTFALYDYITGPGASFLFLPDGHRISSASHEFVGRGWLSWSPTHQSTPGTQDFLFVAAPLTCPPGMEACCGPPNPCEGQPDGTSCDDQNLCTQGDTCQSGACVGGAPMVCTGGDACREATCDPTVGCVIGPKPEGTTCDDGDACTKTDTCQNGACIGGNPVECLPKDACHDAGICDQTTGLCSDPQKADGASCSDQNSCTQGDTCQSGLCVGGAPIVCAPIDSCHGAGVCLGGAGACTNPILENGTPCALPNAPGACLEGVCQPISCTLGYDDCDGDARNGCETDLSTDEANCGACGNVCPAGLQCIDGACQPTNVNEGPTLLGVCTALEDSRCFSKTGWEVKKTTTTPHLTAPQNRPLQFTVTVTETNTTHQLSLSSAVTLTGLIPTGTRVLSVVANLQKGGGGGYTNIASARAGDTSTQSCECPYVQGNDLGLVVRDTAGNSLPSGVPLVPSLPFAQQALLAVEGTFNLASGLLREGDSARLSLCFTFAPDGFSAVPACFFDGGFIQSVQACNDFSMDTCVRAGGNISLHEAMGLPTSAVVELSGFTATTSSPNVSPLGTRVLLPGGAPLQYTIAATGTAGTESTFLIDGRVSCGVAAGSTSLTNTATLGAPESVSSSATVTATCNENTPPPIRVGDYCTYTQGGWGSVAHGNNPGSIRDRFFPAVFPNGVVIGDTGGLNGGPYYAAKFTSAAAVEAFLPAGRTAGVLSADLTNPTSTSAGVLAGQVLSLSLSVAFDDAAVLASAASSPLGDLRVQAGKFAGLTIRELLTLAHGAISGQISVLSQFGANLGDLNGAVDTLNNCFDDCAALCGFAAP